jgi:hypothetical protein
MKMPRCQADEQIGRLIREWLQSGCQVDIDGLGTFLPSKENTFDFIPSSKPRIFIAYVEEDVEQAVRLYTKLEIEGYLPWMDRKRLLPGQNWPRSIERAIQTSDFFIPCFSKRATRKHGTFHAELRYALDCAKFLPLDAIYMIPVRLDHCSVPARIAREIQYVDLFPEWSIGFESIIRTIETQMLRRPPGVLTRPSALSG